MDKQSTVIWLIGQPQLAEYLRFIKNKCVGDSAVSPGQAAAEWRVANDAYYALEKAGVEDIGEAISGEPLEALREAVSALTASHWYEETFSAIPARIVRIDLERTIVSQNHIDPCIAVERVKQLGPRPSEDMLFDFCLPREQSLPPVEVVRLSEGRYRFRSPSIDLRAHDISLLTADAAAGLSRLGPVHSALALPIGFGSNVLSGVSSRGRVVLQNGHNRAYALLAAGHRHAYCVVEDVTCKDELAVAGGGTVNADPEFFFAAARPPLLRDYLDPRFAKTLQTKPIFCEIEVELQIRETNSATESDE